MKNLPTFAILFCLLTILAVFATKPMPTMSAASNASCDLTWDVMLSPDPGAPSNGFDAISAARADDIWAVGTLGEARAGLLLEHWDGAQWALAVAPDVGNNGLPIYATAVETISLTEAWVLGYYEQDYGPVPFSVRWNGSAWSNVSLPSLADGTLSSISGTSPTDIWAVGTQAASALVLHWNGMQWERISNSIAGIEFRKMFRVLARKANDVWMIGEYPKQTSLGADFFAAVVHWDGSTWTEIVELDTEYGPYAHSDLYEQITGFAVAAENDIWVLSELVATASHDFFYRNTRVRRWNGGVWETLEYVPRYASFLSDLKGHGQEAIWVTAGGNLEMEHPEFTSRRWNGTEYSFESLPMPRGYASLTGVDVLSAENVWIVGRRYDYPSPNQPYIVHGHLPCVVSPGAPALLTPKHNAFRRVKPRLEWADVAGAHYYELVVSRNLDSAVPALSTTLLTSDYKFTKPLRRGVTYYWHVRACNNAGCGEWGAWRRFKIKQEISTAPQAPPTSPALASPA
jgi:hypothetical protein